MNLCSDEDEGLTDDIQAALTLCPAAVHHHFAYVVSLMLQRSFLDAQGHVKALVPVLMGKRISWPGF